MRTPRPFDAHRCPWRPTPVPSTLTHGLDPHLLSATRRSARAHAASLARASGSRALDPTRCSAHCRRPSDLAGSQLPARSRMGAGMRALQRRRRPRGRPARTAQRHAPRRPRAGPLHARATNRVTHASQAAASEIARRAAVHLRQRRSPLRGRRVSRWIRARDQRRWRRRVRGVERVRWPVSDAGRPNAGLEGTEARRRCRPWPRPERASLRPRPRPPRA
jgi:hypothetical protein